MAEPGAEPPIGAGRALDGPALDVEPPEEHEAAPVDDLVAERVELRAEGREDEVGGADRLERQVRGLPPRRVQLRAVGGGEPHDPVVPRAHFGPGPGGRPVVAPPDLARIHRREGRRAGSGGGRLRCRRGVRGADGRASGGRCRGRRLAWCAHALHVSVILRRAGRPGPLLGMRAASGGASLTAMFRSFSSSRGRWRGGWAEEQVNISIGPAANVVPGPRVRGVRASRTALSLRGPGLRGVGGRAS